MGELDDAGNRSTEKRAHWLMNPEPDHRRPRDRSSPVIRGLTLTAKCEKTLQSIGKKKNSFLYQISPKQTFIRFFIGNIKVLIQ